MQTYADIDITVLCTDKIGISHKGAERKRVMHEAGEI